MPFTPITDYGFRESARDRALRGYVVAAIQRADPTRATLLALAEAVVEWDGAAGPGNDSRERRAMVGKALSAIVAAESN